MGEDIGNSLYFLIYRVSESIAILKNSDLEIF